MIMGQINVLNVNNDFGKNRGILGNSLLISSQFWHLYDWFEPHPLIFLIIYVFAAFNYHTANKAYSQNILRSPNSSYVHVYKK